MAKKPPKVKVYKFPNLEAADTSAMGFEELQNFCLQVFQQIDIEKKECEKYQVERDKLLRYWYYSGDNFKQALFDLRDQELCLENNEYSMKTRMDRKVQEVCRLKSDATETIEETLVRRCAQIVNEHHRTVEKTHEVWSDVQRLKSTLINIEDLRSESLTDRTYVKQTYLELISKNMLKQRRFDLVRLNKELHKERKKASAANAAKFRDEIRLKRDIMKSAIKTNNCSLKNLVSSFERILSYNFEKVSDLKDKAEHLKKLDIMLSKEYSEASKAFYKSVSSHSEGMKTLNQMRTFLYAAGKTERGLVNKKKELCSNQVRAEALSVKQLNCELRINELEDRMKDLTETVVSYRKVMTRMFREDADIFSRNIEKSLVELFQQKIRLYSLISPDAHIDLEWETADVNFLTFRTENLGDIQKFLEDFQTACSAVVALYNRLFKLWRIDYNHLGISVNDARAKAFLKNTIDCRAMKCFEKW